MQALGRAGIQVPRNASNVRERPRCIPSSTTKIERLSRQKQFAQLNPVTASRLASLAHHLNCGSRSVLNRGIGDSRSPGVAELAETLQRPRHATGQCGCIEGHGRERVCDTRSCSESFNHHSHKLSS